EGPVSPVLPITPARVAPEGGAGQQARRPQEEGKPDHTHRSPLGERETPDRLITPDDGRCRRISQGPTGFRGQIESSRNTPTTGPPCSTSPRGRSSASRYRVAGSIPSAWYTVATRS